jgi:hypothetical protein
MSAIWIALGAVCIGILVTAFAVWNGARNRK